MGYKRCLSPAPLLQNPPPSGPSQTRSSRLQARGPTLRRVSPSAMRSILVLGFMATFTVAAVESLTCAYCPLSPDCSDVTRNCEEEDSVSCGASSISWPEGVELQKYYEKFCSTQPVGTSLSFAVRVTGQQQVLFSNKFCNENEDCEPTPPENFPEDGTSNTQCPACLGSNVTSCVGTPQTCNDGERCVDLLAVLTFDGGPQQMALKGCSNINDDACNQLSVGNVVVGDITFQHLVCTTPNPISTPEQTTTPDSSTTATPSTTSNSSSSSNTTATPSTTSNSSSGSNTTGTLSTNSNSSSNTTTFPTTTDSSGLSQAAKLPWIASLVLGLLLL